MLPRAGGSPVGLAVKKARSRILILAMAPTGGACSRIWQHPRFVARKRGSMVEIRCYVEDPGIVSWLRKQEADLEPKIFPPEEGRIIQNQTTSEATLIIQGVQFQDNGVYYCKQECSKEPLRTEQGCGTELRVMGVCKACPPSPLARKERGDAHGPSVPPLPSLPPVRGGGVPGWGQGAVVLEPPGEPVRSRSLRATKEGPSLTVPAPPSPRVQHPGTAEAAEHAEGWHHHDPDPAHHPLHHRAHLPAPGQGDGDRGAGKQPEGRPDVRGVSVSPEPAR